MKRRKMGYPPANAPVLLSVAFIVIFLGSSLLLDSLPSAADQDCACSCCNKCDCGMLVKVPHVYPKEIPLVASFTSAFVLKGFVCRPESAFYSFDYNSDVFRPPNRGGHYPGSIIC